MPEPVKRPLRALRDFPSRIVPLSRELYHRLNRTDEKRRLKIAMHYVDWRVKSARNWAKQQKEESNFYYDLTDTNKTQLAHMLSVVTRKTPAEFEAYFAELAGDNELRLHLTQALVHSGYGRDIVIEYGRRIGWYALARAIKPKVIVETGVDHGVGSCVLASALLRNSREGFPGRYYGTDLNPSAGRLLTGQYAAVGEILYGDSITSLTSFDSKIDLFINDSDHSAEYEAREYQTIKDKLTSDAIILGDNSHSTDKLALFSDENKRSFLFFAEKPMNHWYPGAGIGISFV